MPNYRAFITWTRCGIMSIEANNEDEANEIFKNSKPKDWDIEDMWDSLDVEIEENEEG